MSEYPSCDDGEYNAPVDLTALLQVKIRFEELIWSCSVSLLRLLMRHDIPFPEEGRVRGRSKGPQSLHIYPFANLADYIEEEDQNA